MLKLLKKLSGLVKGVYERLTKKIAENPSENGPEKITVGINSYRSVLKEFCERVGLNMEESMAKMKSSIDAEIDHSKTLKSTSGNMYREAVDNYNETLRIANQKLTQSKAEASAIATEAERINGLANEGLRSYLILATEADKTNSK